jgi:hypothetical protein
MGHQSLLQLIRVACDHWEAYNDNTRKELLSAIFWLCDSMIEDLKARPDHQSYEHAISELCLMQDFAEKGLSENPSLYRDAFQQVKDCILRVIPLPNEPV